MTSRVTVASRWIITGIPMGVYTGSILKPPRSIHWGDDGGGNGPLAFGLVLRHEAACAKPPRLPRSRRSAIEPRPSKVGSHPRR